MFPQSLIGILIILIAIFIAFKLFKSLVKIGVVVILFLVGGYLLFGGLPSFGGVSSEPAGGVPAEGGLAEGEPIGGGMISIPEESRVKDIIVAAKNIAWGIEILTAEWDADGTLLIAVTNTGQFPIGGIEAWVNDDEVDITNTLPASLEKGETAILDTNYMAKGPMTIKVRAGQAEDEITLNP